jgi:hypothetical protein
LWEDPAAVLSTGNPQVSPRGSVEVPAAIRAAADDLSPFPPELSVVMEKELFYTEATTVPAEVENP